MEQTKEYSNKLEIGQKFQDFLISPLIKIGLIFIPYQTRSYQNRIGESFSGIEIKKDQQFRETGNLYIEYAEKSNRLNKDFYPSGIKRNDNTWLYIIGDEDTVYIFGKEQLYNELFKNRFYLRKYEGDNDVTYHTTSIDTSKGFLLPIEVAKMFAIKIYEIN